MQRLKKSKIILLFSLCILIYAFITLNIEYKSKYKDTDKYIFGKIIEKKQYDNRLSLTIKGKEKVLLNCYDCNINPSLGSHIKAYGEFIIPNKNSVFNLFNYQNYLKSKKIKYIFNIETYEIIKNDNIFYKMKNTIINRINNINNSYLNTFILGENKIDEDIYKTYQNNGISHLFAISGMHISLITLILFFLLKKILKKEIVVYIIISLFLLFYMFLTNFSPSVIRSSCLFIGISFSKKLKLDFKSLDILLLILDIMLIYNPFYLYNISFLFSFTISFYLIIFSKTIGRFKNYFIKIFIISLISFFVSLPIVINNFFTINILSPIVNIVAVPLISLVIFPLSLLTAIFPVFNKFLLILLDKFEIVSLFFSKISLNLSFGRMNFVMLILYYLIVTSIISRFKKYKIFVFLMIMAIYYNINFFNINPKITFIDVGQGDATLLELPFNKGNILIDTGGNKNYDLNKNIFTPYLKSIGIKKLNYLILTHGDYDHMGASIDLIDSFKINKVIFNSYENNELENKLIEKINKKKIKYSNYNKKILNINNYKLYFMNEKHYDENQDSLIIYTKINEKNILLMGDANNKNENLILDEYNLPKMDILKVGHHGSKTSSSLSFLNKIKPKYSLISVAKKNIYNHPNKEVIDNLNKVGSNIFLTSINGSVKFVLKKHLEIYTCY